MWFNLHLSLIKPYTNILEWEKNNIKQVTYNSFLQKPWRDTINI